MTRPMKKWPNPRSAPGASTGGLLLALLVAVLLVAVPAGVADGEEPEIAFVSPRVEGHRVLVDFELVGAFDRDLVERVESGLPTGIVYELELLRDRRRWFDRALGEADLQVVAMYDAIAEEYLVNYKLDGKLIESRMVRNLEDLEAALTRFEGLPIFTLDPPPESWPLLVAVRARFAPETIFSFIPTSRETAWSRSREFWSPETPPPSRQ